MLTSTLVIAVLAAAFPASYAQSSSSPVVSTTCNGKPYVYQELAGYGSLPGNARDRFGDTLGGIGSSIALESGSWRKRGQSYEGIMWTLPDRGWNTEGTLNYQTRVHQFKITFTPNTSATLSNPAPPNLQLQYLDSVAFTGPDGTPATGLDADATGSLSYNGFPPLPAATYEGDGFGDPGPGGKRISMDCEGLVLGRDGSIWVSDEYGPYIYRFNRRGRMVAAIRPPDAFVPRRNGTVSFNSDTPPVYDPEREIIPQLPESGRNNNQGLEGMTVSPDGNTLYILMQSALIQDGGATSSNRRYTRLLIYDISGRHPKHIAEHVVPLPTFASGSSTRVAAQSEILYISKTQFLILARDSGAGRGQDESLSLYRHADVFDISNATNVMSAQNDAVNGSIASAAGVLKAGVVPATYCSFLDFNINEQLGRFGLHNGGEQDAGLLNEKWEGLALAPVDGAGGKDGEYFLFSFSDNDFITQDGYMRGGTLPYADSSGFNLDNQALVFKVKVPVSRSGGKRPHKSW
ncbi:hypothetical protein H2199_007863 [Coniosporium tulheliwenetii]|uniref:Uncharacterized protein n=1 Tax=Coniosporium tulheliwenetii TaxID=3383036 RepID=A0ACC2YNE7_9PEZI|nr:hypothetical protein H2199_007863 [Cladosporium sp. JES 115]